MVSPRERHDLMDLAKNPTPGTRIYRAHIGEGSSAGIHWTTNKDVATSTGLGGEGVHEAILDRPAEQAIPHGALSRIQFVGGQVKRPQDSRDMGWDWEAEVRLRPGTTVRTTGGGELPIKHGGGQFYSNLADYSVPGTSEAAHHANLQAGLPHTQPALFDEYVNRQSGKAVGYEPSLEAAGMKAWNENWDAAEAKHGGYEQTEPREMTRTSQAAPTLSSHLTEGGYHLARRKDL
jgi:hypothetical protein